GEGIVEIDNGTGTPLASLGITATASSTYYYAPAFQASPHYTVPRWGSSQTTPEPTGSVWQKTTNVNLGANIVLKKYNGPIRHDSKYYIDGVYEIRVRIYDREGNLGVASLQVYVENGLFNMRMWGPWIMVIIIGTIIASIIIYLISEKKGKLWINRKRDISAEEIRLKDIDKDQILKRIELFESGNLIERPIILHCKFCKSWFESSKFNYICPVCEHDQIYVAYNCMNCNKWYFLDEPGDNYFCKNKKCRGVKLIRRELEEVKEILGNKGILLRKYEQKKNRFSILE
ncbi:MAG: hypothetical protein ACFFKA_10585, partial [Candidatus Thorarchaeota archaeon]